MRGSAATDSGSSSTVDAGAASAIAEEFSQAKARLGVCVFALLYIAGWTLLSGPVRPLTAGVLLGYTAFSAAWILLVKLRPGEVPWRRMVVIFSDLAINTFFMHALQAKGAFFYPMYLWIIVGNGMRFGPRYLIMAMVVGVAYFGPMLVWSDYWRANAVAGSGLLAGMIVLPLFYLALIRNLHQANARLSEEVERSQAAVKAKTEFLSNMSHELRTPMNGVIGVTELMRATELTDTQREQLAIIRRSAGSLLNIIDDVLELSRIEAGKISLNPVTLDLKAIIDDVDSLLRPGALEKGLEIHVTHPADGRRTFVGDPTRIRQILLNLVGNAVKFTERGRIDIAYRSTHRTDDRADVSLTVADTGAGIAADNLPQIFDKFERASVRPGQVAGSGLGLAISRHLARMMGGDITVESEVGRGSTFTVKLILEPTEETLITEDRGPEEPRGSYALSVLVVEDNPVNQLVIQGYLETLGISVVSTDDGQSALDLIENQSFDLVFMDVRLPILDGLEATRRIRADEKDGQRLPIVALTANAFAEDREACLEAGMDLHLRKPMQIEDLQSAIETLRERGLVAPGQAGQPA